MRTSENLTLESIYSRDQLKQMFNITDATVNTGVFQPSGHDSVWLFVTERKTPDRTQYADFLDADVLYWDGQSRGRTDDKIINHINDGNELLLFYRKEKYEFPHAAFRYVGLFEYTSHTGAGPSHFVLVRANIVQEQAVPDINGYEEEESVFMEGERRQRFTNFYERNPRIRTAAIRIHGTVCQVCGFDFQARYSERGRGYIEVHHTIPVSTVDGAVLVNPATDMAVLCANCHRMIHRRRDEVLSINELRELIHEFRI